MCDSLICDKPAGNGATDMFNNFEALAMASRHVNLYFICNINKFG